MSYSSNRTLLEKADLALGPHGRRRRAAPCAGAEVHADAHQAVGADADGDRRADGVSEAPALEDQVREPHPPPRPDLSFLELDAKLFKAEVYLSEEVLEDNIERGELRQNILEMIAEAAGRDMEERLRRPVPRDDGRLA
jgi:hypothetical protein